MTETRQGEVTFQGNPLELVGPKLAVGEPAPAFTCAGDGMKIVALTDTPARVRVFSVVPSLDTPVCQTQTKTFAERFPALGDKAVGYTVSVDTPFAMGRFAQSVQGAFNNLSDLHDFSFGKNWGVLIQGLPIPLLARAVFVVDAENTIRYVEIVPEIAQEPDYAKAMAVVEELTG